MKMEVSILVTWLMVCAMEMAYSTIRMEATMMVDGSRTWWMAMENYTIKLES